MIGKADIAAGVVAVGSAVLGQTSSAVPSVPGVAEVSNLSAMGALIYIVLWTIPKIARDFREEMKEERDFHRSESEKIRQAFTCKGEK